MVEILRSLQTVAPRDLRVGLRALPAAFTSAYRAGALGLPLPRAGGGGPCRRGSGIPAGATPAPSRITTTSATTSTDSCSGRA